MNLYCWNLKTVNGWAAIYVLANSHAEAKSLATAQIKAEVDTIEAGLLLNEVEYIKPEIWGTPRAQIVFQDS